jgi:hypothetical protein
VSFRALKLKFVPAGTVIHGQPAGMRDTVQPGQTVLEMSTGRLHVARKPTREILPQQD